MAWCLVKHRDNFTLLYLLGVGILIYDVKGKWIEGDRELDADQTTWT
jgi:hypothetical protein